MASPPSTLGIGHIALRCRDIDAMERFYCEVLGFVRVWSPASSDRYLSSGSDNLALHASPGETCAAETRLDHFGLLVASPSDVDAWAEHLRAAGVELEGAPKTHRDQSRSLYVRDPEGNRIQIIHLGPGVLRGR